MFKRKICCAQDFKGKKCFPRTWKKQLSRQKKKDIIGYRKATNKKIKRKKDNK